MFKAIDTSGNICVNGGRFGNNLVEKYNFPIKKMPSFVFIFTSDLFVELLSHFIRGAQMSFPKTTKKGTPNNNGA